MLLKCTSTYPATPENSNILTIPQCESFNCQIGLSDHTMGIGVAVASMAMGATVVEKHFTLRRADGGVDSAFSLEPHEFRLLREEVDRAWQAIGKITYGGTARRGRLARRSAARSTSPRTSEPARSSPRATCAPCGRASACRRSSSTR